MAGYFALTWFAKIFAFYWKVGYEKRQKKREEKRLEELKWRYSHVTLDNPLLNQMRNDRTIVFMGDKGKGKSKMMNLFAKFLVNKRDENIKKNKRYLKYMNQDYLEQNAWLKKKNKLPVYANVEYIDYTTGKRNQVLQPYFEMDKKAVEGAIFCIDEISSTYGKDLYNNNDDDAVERKKNAKENSKKNRHYTDGWILGTEQDGQDIFIGIRENGYAIVHCLQTIVSLRRRGKILRLALNLLNLILPAFFTIDKNLAFRENLFFRDKTMYFLKLLLPSYISMPYYYYLEKQRINNIIQRKYRLFQTRFTYGTGEYWINYTHADLFDDNTREYKAEYDKMFDKNGNRIKKSEATA